MSVVPCGLPISKNQIRYFAVAFGNRLQVDGHRVPHASIIFRDEEATLCRIELVDTTGRIVVDELSESTCEREDAWIVPKLSDEILRHLSCYCCACGMEKIEFGFDLKNDEFTCATFVLSVFWKYRVELFDESSWEIDAEDRSYQERLWQSKCRELAAKGLDSSAIGRSSFQVFNRFRPEDIIGACMSGKEKVSFHEVRSNAALLISWMDQIRTSHD